MCSVLGVAQCIVGISSVQWGILKVGWGLFCALGVYHKLIGGISSVHWGRTISVLGEIMICAGGYNDLYKGISSVHWGGSTTVVISPPQCTEHPPLHSLISPHKL